MRRAVLVLWVAFVGCSSDVVTSSAPVAADCPVEGRPDDGDLPLDVADVLIARCQTCHADPPTGAPWPLTRWEDVEAPYGMTGRLRWQRMAEVVEPGAFPHMPPLMAQQPTADEQVILHDWFQGCALPVPEGTGGDAE
jgi:uncharacterized membrane protein